MELEDQTLNVTSRLLIFFREGVDLVEQVLRLTPKLPLSRWPALRSRLGPGRLQKARLPDDALPDVDDVDYSRVWHRENLDHLRFDIVARTLCIVGGPDAFGREGARLRELMADGPSYPRGMHLCVEIDAGCWGTLAGRTCPGRVHIVYNDTWKL